MKHRWLTVDLCDFESDVHVNSGFRIVFKCVVFFCSVKQY